MFRREIDDCAQAAADLAAAHEPFEALRRWMLRLSAFFAAKRGLAGALHSGEPAYAALPAHFDARLRPALERLLASAIAWGRIRSDVAADELLGAVARLSMTEAGGPRRRNASWRCWRMVSAIATPAETALSELRSSSTDDRFRAAAWHLRTSASGSQPER